MNSSQNAEIYLCMSANAAAEIRQSPEFEKKAGLFRMIGDEL